MATILIISLLADLNICLFHGLKEIYDDFNDSLEEILGYFSLLADLEVVCLLYVLQGS